MMFYMLPATLAMLVANTAAAPVSIDLARFWNSSSLSDAAVDPAVMDYLQQQDFEKNGNHLWFYYLDNGTAAGPAYCNTGSCRCGQIDAAQRMPAALFKPVNRRALANYATLTIEYYASLGMDIAAGRRLALGQCKDNTAYTNKHGRTTAYSCCEAGVQGINWVTGQLMGAICKQQCDCTYPSCKDVPDQPLRGKWCSLCGPKYNDYITIGLCNLPNDAFDDDASGDDDCL